MTLKPSLQFWVAVLHVFIWVPLVSFFSLIAIHRSFRVTTFLLVLMSLPVMAGVVLTGVTWAVLRKELLLRRLSVAAVCVVLCYVLLIALAVTFATPIL